MTPIRQSTLSRAPETWHADEATPAKERPSQQTAAESGLPTRAPSSSSTVPPRDLTTLHGDVHRNIGERLDARSMVAFAATSQATRAAMQESPAHAQATRIFPRVTTARSAAEFEAGLEALKDIQHSKVQAEALGVLTERFVTAHAALDSMEALTLRSALIDALKNIPVRPGSAEAVAPGVIAAFDSIRAMTHRAHRLTTDVAALSAVAPQDFERVMLECSSVLEAVTPDHLALNEVVNTHGLAALREPMIELMDKFFDEHSTPHAVQFATVMFPVRLAKLEPGSVGPSHVVDLLTRLAQHAIGPGGVNTIGDPAWGGFASDKIKAALEAHRIDLANQPVLGAALRSLEAAG